ncbi:MAG: cytochrome c [Chloroflexi bacterium]|nr:cytochrome c [Chloroflexota bacterium]
MRRLSLFILGTVLMLSGCGGGEKKAESHLDPNTDAGRGEQVFKTHCAACHAVKGDRVVVGPSLAGVAKRAATRVEGLAAEDYLRESIIYPNDYTVEGFAEGAMQQNFATQLTSDEVNYLVAYLMTLK